MKLMTVSRTLCASEPLNHAAKAARPALTTRAVARRKPNARMLAKESA